jgi:MT0933-like antitoxin protein
MHTPGEAVTMGIFDKAKDALSGNEDKIDAGIDKAGDMVDEKTGDRYTEQVDKGQDMAKDAVRDFTSDQPEQPA